MARAAAGSAGRSSTPRRCPAAPPAARWSTPSGRLLGINSVRVDGGLILAIAADAALRQRVDALGRGEPPQRARLGVAIAPPRVARRLRRAVGLPERDGVLVRGVED